MSIFNKILAATLLRSSGPIATDAGGQEIFLPTSVDSLERMYALEKEKKDDPIAAQICAAIEDVRLGAEVRAEAIQGLVNEALVAATRGKAGRAWFLRKLARELAEEVGAELDPEVELGIDEIVIPPFWDDDDAMADAEERGVSQEDLRSFHEILMERSDLEGWHGEFAPLPVQSRAALIRAALKIKDKMLRAYVARNI